MLKNIQKKLKLDQKEGDTVRELYEIPKKDKGEEIPSTKRSGADPGLIYQADTLYMPADKGFKYLLVVVDAINGITDAEPMKERDGSTVEKAFKKIFSRNRLKMPRYEIQMDQGAEFKNKRIEKYFEDNNVGIKWGKVDRSRQQALVESRNKTIATSLFQKQTEQEVKTLKKNTKWVADLDKVLDGINEYQEIKFKNDQKETLRKDPYLPKGTIVLPVGTKVRTILDKPRGVLGEKLKGYHFRSTDIRWDPKVKTITNIILNPAQPVLYQVDDDNSVAYTFNQLQVVKS